MNRLKHELKLNIKKNIFINEMLLVELILCFVMCAFALVTANDIKNQAASFKKTYGDKQFLRVIDRFENMYEDDFFYTPNYIGKMIYAYEQMKKNNRLNFHSQVDNPIYIENAPDDIRFCDSPPEDEIRWQDTLLQRCKMYLDGSGRSGIQRSKDNRRTRL